MTDASIATIGFKVDTAPLLAGDAALLKMAGSAGIAEAAILKMQAATSKAFAKVNPAFLGGGAGASGGGAGTGYGAHAIGIGAVSTALDGFTAASGKASAATGAHAAVLRGATEAHHAHGAAVGFNTSKLMELQHVGRSVIDVLASGGSLTRAFTVESGRLFEIFGPGTAKVKEAIAAFRSIPIAARVAGGAIAGVGIASALAFAEYESGQDKLTNSLNGIGRRSGATTAQLNQVAANAAIAGHISNGESIALAAQYTSAGIAPGATGALIGMTRDYGRVTGLGTEAGGTALASAMRDPIKGLSDLDKQLGFVDDRLKQQVDDLVRSGHLQEAQTATLEGLRHALEATKDTTWNFSKALEGASSWLGNKMGQVGGGIAAAFGMNSDSDKLAELRQRAANLSRVDPVGNADYIAEIRHQMEPLVKSVQAQDAQAAANQRDSRAVDLSRQAGDAVRAILPDVVRANSARDTLEVLRQAMADPLIRQHMSPDDARLVGRAYGNAGVVADMARPGVHERQDYQLRLAANDAFSTGEKAIIDARRAELQVLRETGDVMHAARSAQEALNLAIDKRNRDAADELDVAKDQRSLVGLSGLQRRLEELRLQFEGTGGVYAKDEVEHSRALDDASIKHDLSGASKLMSAAEDASTGITMAGGRLAASLDGITAKIGGPYGAGPKPMTGGTTVAAGAAAFNRAPADIQSMIRDAAGRTGIDPNVIAAIGEKENSFRLTGGTSMMGANGKPSSAWGYGQLTNGAAADVARQVPGFNKYDPNTAVFGSAEYLKILMDRNHGNLGSALNAYGGTPDYATDIARRTGGVAGAGADRTAMTVHPSLAPITPIASTAVTSDRARYGVLADTMKRDTIEQLFNGANTSLAGQNASLQTQIETFGKSAAAIKGAGEAQGLWNRLAADSLGPAGALSKQTGELADRTRAYGAAVARSTEPLEAELRLKKQIQDLEDTARNGFSGSLSSGLVAAAHGRSFGDAFKSGMSGLGDQLIGKGTGLITGGLLGQSGQGIGTGLLGNLLTGHFAGGTSDAPGGLTEVGENGPEVVALPQHAQVISNGAAQGLMAGRPAGHTFNFGDTHIHPVGGAQFTPDQVREISGQVQQGQHETVEHITRNLPQIQQDAGQSG